MRSRMASLVFVFLVVFLTACQDQVTEPPAGSPQHAISDATHGLDGNPGFHWLAPMVPQPAASSLGTFAPGLSPSVRLICLFTTDPGIECDPDTAIVQFALGSGLLLQEGDYYQLNLHTDEHGLHASTAEHTTIYRIQVLTDPMTELGGPFELGYADLQLASNGREAKNLSSNEMIALVDGRTLPVKFRIDQGAYEHELQVAEATTPGDPDGPLCQDNCTVQVVPSTQQTEVSLTESGSDEEVTGVVFEEGDLATTSIVVIDERRTDGPDENCATGVTVDKRFCYRYKVFPDVPFNEPVRFGICPRDLPIGPGSYWRLFKVDFDETGRPIVTRPPMVDVSDFLPCTNSGGGTPIGLLQRAALYAFDWLVSPLNAAVGEKGWGGMAQDFSDVFWAEDAEMSRIGAAHADTTPGSTLSPTVQLQAVNVVEPTVPLAGAQATFEITEGTGWLSPASETSPIASDTTPDGRVFRLTVETDEAGLAAVQWTVGGGANALEATSSAAFTVDGEPILFTATAVQPELSGLVVDANNYQVALTPNQVGAGYFRGVSALFAGQVAYGTDASRVFFYDTRGFSESFVAAGIDPFVSASGPADHYTAALIVESDDQDLGPRQHLNLVTLRETFAWADAADADYVIVRYALVSPNETFDDLHLGFFADLDVGSDQNANVSEYDGTLEAALTYNPDEAVRSAFVFLDREVATYRQWANPSFALEGQLVDPADLTGWFELLSAGNDVGPFGVTDVRNALTTGAVTLPGGGATTLAVALVAGENDSDLAANVAAARARYASVAAPPTVHVLEMDLFTDGGFAAVLTFPAEAGAFVVADARCGHAPVTVVPTEGPGTTLTFSEPVPGPDGRVFCSGRLADGSYFTGWDYIVEPIQ